MPADTVVTYKLELLLNSMVVASSVDSRTVGAENPLTSLALLYRAKLVDDSTLQLQITLEADNLTGDDFATIPALQYQLGYRDYGDDYLFTTVLPATCNESLDD